MRKLVIFSGVFFGFYLALLAGALLLRLPVFPRMDVHSALPATFTVSEGKTFDVLLLSPDESFYSNSPANVKVRVEWNDGSGVLPSRTVSYQVVSDDSKNGKMFGHGVLSVRPMKSGEVTASLEGEFLKQVRLATQQPLLPAFVTLGIITLIAAVLACWFAFLRTKKTATPH